MPAGCRWVEKEEEEAEVGPLALPSIIVKLSDLEWLLPSLAQLAEFVTYGCDEDRPFARELPSCGVELLPIGVASLNCGGA